MNRLYLVAAIKIALPLLRHAAKRSDNELDDQIVDFVEKLLNGTVNIADSTRLVEHLKTVWNEKHYDLITSGKKK